MAFWQVPPPHLATDPPVLELAAGGVTPLELDLTPYLAEGETPHHPRATITEVGTSEARDLPTSLRGATLVVAVRGLVAGRAYTLSRGWTISAMKQPTRLTIVRALG